MIIVSQDKGSIYNFENIKSIDIVENEVYITDDILVNAGVRIGKYKTEKRAKQILEDIISFYIRNEMQNKVYRMPKE